MFWKYLILTRRHFNCKKQNMLLWKMPSSIISVWWWTLPDASKKQASNLAPEIRLWLYEEWLQHTLQTKKNLTVDVNMLFKKVVVNTLGSSQMLHASKSPSSIIGMRRNFSHLWKCMYVCISQCIHTKCSMKSK